MIRNALVLAVIVGALLAAQRPAAAQYGGGGMGTAASPWAVTVGWMWNAGDTPVDNEMVVGLQYIIKQMAMVGSSPKHQWVLSADWLRVDSERTVGVPATRRRVSLVPLLLVHKHHFFPGWYGMVGIGARWADRDVPEMRITDNIGFAWQLGAGYDVGSKWFVEGRYLAGVHPSDDGLWGAQAGYRF